MRLCVEKQRVGTHGKAGTKPVWSVLFDCRVSHSMFDGRVKPVLLAGFSERGIMIENSMVISHTAFYKGETAILLEAAGYQILRTARTSTRLDTVGIGSRISGVMY